MQSISAPAPLGNHPETFRLPKSGTRDPYFGFSRSFYYAAEAQGLIRLIRIRKRGNTRGITLVSFAAIAKMVRDQAANAE